MLERELKNYLVKRCKELEIYHRKFESPGTTSVPDWILANNGKVVFVELKASGKKPTAAQDRELDRLSSAGAYATWISSFEELEFLLNFLTEPPDYEPV